MKTKYLRKITIALIVGVSCFSFLYLNYGVSTDEDEQQTMMETDQSKSVDEDSVLTELSILKSVGKKLLEVVVFVI